MKKIITFLAITFLMISCAFAQTTTIAPEVEAGTTPNSFFYGIDVFFDNLKIGFAKGITNCVNTHCR